MTFSKSLAKTLLFAGIALFALSGTVDAGEPLHPFWQQITDPIIDPFYQLYHLFF